MGKEAEYLAQLQSLGIYEEAFRPTVHQLCIQERELSRVMKAWKATAPPGKSPSVLDPHYDVITKLRKDILVIRESLGLTPKGLQRIRESRPARRRARSRLSPGSWMPLPKRCRPMSRAPHFDQVLDYARATAADESLCELTRLSCSRLIDIRIGGRWDFNPALPEFCIEMMEGLFCYSSGELLDGTPLRGKPNRYTYMAPVLHLRHMRLSPAGHSDPPLH